MKILFIVPSYRPAYIYGGTIVVVALLAEHLAAAGHEVDVFTTTANGKNELDVVPGRAVNVDGVNVTYFKRITGDHTHISTALWKHLARTVKQYDIVHIHSWWNPLVIGAAMICRSIRVKTVISPHGMLNTYILTANNSLSKRLIQFCIGKSILSKHAWLLASTAMELEQAKFVIPNLKGEAIPNLVLIPERHFDRTKNDTFTIGFLSRIHPKKGLDILIKALAQVNFPYRLSVAGAGDEEYVASLKTLAQQCGNADKIDWVGWAGEEGKFKFLSGVDLFALTSHNENFAVVVIESLAVGTPVLVSTEVGLVDYVTDTNYGWSTTTNPDDVAHSLNTIINSQEKLQWINQEAPEGVRKDYAPSNLVASYLRFYHKICS